MNHWSALAVAALFTWFGMVAAISFLEAPLKFRAPGVTLPIGLGIGRLVFRALNICEVALATVVVVAVVLGRPPAVAVVAAGVAVAALGAQVVLVRPALSRRSDAVLAGGGRRAFPCPPRLRRPGSRQGDRPAGRRDSAAALTGYPPPTTSTRGTGSQVTRP